jgi:hypothetical protein
MTDITLLKSQFKINMDRAEKEFGLFHRQLELLNDMVVKIEGHYREAIGNYKSIIDEQAKQIDELTQEKK